MTIMLPMMTLTLYLPLTPDEVIHGALGCDQGGQAGQREEEQGGPHGAGGAGGAGGGGVGGRPGAD